jgi:hypothetical protein
MVLLLPFYLINLVFYLHQNHLRLYHKFLDCHTKGKCLLLLHLYNVISTTANCKSKLIATTRASWCTNNSSVFTLKSILNFLIIQNKYCQLEKLQLIYKKVYRVQVLQNYLMQYVFVFY